MLNLKVNFVEKRKPDMGRLQVLANGRSMEVQRGDRQQAVVDFMFAAIPVFQLHALAATFSNVVRAVGQRTMVDLAATPAVHLVGS